MIDSSNNIKMMSNVFGINRIVDAKNKKIISLNNELHNLNNHKCFNFWQTESECINCISIRALNENKSFSKIETVNDRIYFMIASPLNINDDRYVLELFKDITEDDMRSFLAVDINDKMKEEVLRLNKLLVIDDLTNTFNRRYIKEKLPYSLQRFIKKELTLSIIMMDIDKFKNINDTYGHDCGDYILKEVSKTLLDFTSKHNGWVARYGGDEFIIVFENLSELEAYNKANNLKEIIDSNKFNYGEHEIDITCSIGVSYPIGDNLDIDSIIKEADIKLYESKRNLDSIK